MSEQIMIVEIKEDKGSALTTDGSFISFLCTQAYQVGDTISLSDVTVLTAKRAKARTGFLAAVAALLILTIFLGSWVYLLPVEAAVLVVDINPSLELYLDSQATVMRTKALNQAGIQLLNEYPLTGLSLEEVWPTLIAAARQSGYLAAAVEENLIVVGVVNAENWRVKARKISPIKLEAVNEQISATLIANEVAAVVAVAPVSGQQFKQASEKKVSVNKLTATNKLKQMDIDLSLEKLQEKGFSEIVKQSNIPPGQLISKAAKVRKVIPLSTQKSNNSKRQQDENQANSKPSKTNSASKQNSGNIKNDAHHGKATTKNTNSNKGGKGGK